MDSHEEYQHFFEVELPLFRGPIDLLLHLVKKDELEIEKVSLATVADQYFACIDHMGQIDLEVAGEYLVIAATLLSVKSSMLLNEPVELVEDEEGNLVDPHEELLRKLREAEVYKDGASQLGSRDQYGFDVFPTVAQLKSVPAPDAEYRDHDPFLLGKAFQKVLEGTDGSEKTYDITLESVSIAHQMMRVLDQLKEVGRGEAGHRAVAFQDLIPDLKSRASVIGTFVALLELCKRQAIVVRQEEEGEEIVIALASDEDVQVDILSSEFDDITGAEEPLYGNGETVNG